MVDSDSFKSQPYSSSPIFLLGFYNRDCVNIATLVLRLYSKIFDQLAQDTMRAIGRQDYLNDLEILGPVRAAEDKFMFTVMTVAKYTCKINS